MIIMTMIRFYVSPYLEICCISLSVLVLALTRPATTVSDLLFSNEQVAISSGCPAEGQDELRLKLSSIWDLGQ